MAPLIRKKKLRSEKPTVSVGDKTGDTLSTPSVLTREDNPFLRQAKSTKKEKRDNKRDTLHERLKAATHSGISKSSARRQKRKAKSNLNSNLSDLLSSLPVTTPDKSSNALTGAAIISASGYIQSKPKLIDPKKSSKKNEKVVKEEMSRFNKVLAEKEFRQSPFDTLKSFISANIEKKEDFIKMDKKRKEKELSTMRM